MRPFFSLVLLKSVNNIISMPTLHLMVQVENTNSLLTLMEDLENTLQNFDGKIIRCDVVEPVYDVRGLEKTDRE